MDGENFQISFGEFEAIVADGSTYLNVGGTWQELPDAAGSDALVSSPLSPAEITESIEDLNYLEVAGIEIVERGLIDVLAAPV